MAAGRGAVPGGTEVSLRALCRIQLCSNEAAEQLGAAQPLGGPRSPSERCAASSSAAMNLQSSWARRSPWGDQGLPQSAVPHPALQQSSCRAAGHGAAPGGTKVFLRALCRILLCRRGTAFGGTAMHLLCPVLWPGGYIRGYPGTLHFGKPRTRHRLAGVAAAAAAAYQHHPPNVQQHMAQSSPASACPSSAIPSHPPSRQSTRIITLVKTHANYVRPNNNTRRSLVRHVSATSDHKVSSDSHQPVIQSKRPSKSAVAPSSSTQVETATPSQINTTSKSKKRKRATANDSDPDLAVMDLTQDADPKNKKAQKKIKKTPGVGLKEIDNIALYFEPPFRGKEEHRNGNLARSACPGRSSAIKAGANLPVTLKEQQAEETQAASSAMNKFVQGANFDNRVLNQMLVIWLVSSSQPWKQIEDKVLGFAFNYTRRGVHIFLQAWAAAEAHCLYINLQEKVMNTIKSLKLKILLIHDLWTTKGNGQAFMGVSFTYVLEDWTYKLSVQCTYIIGQTTNSGSNNQTMTAAVDSILLQKNGKDPNLVNAHIQCFCHKITLIFSAGLKAIDLPTKVLTKQIKALGFVPALGTIIKTDEPMENNPTDSSTENADCCSESESDDPPAGYSDVSNSGSESGDAVSESKSTTKKSKLLVILSKVDLVIQRITSSAVKHSKFKVWCKKLDYNGPSLIAGHEIQWNIRWESRKRAFQARKVIAKLIKNKRDRQERDGGENFFQDHKISRSKWDLVK
ncbi:hypothetical protein PCANC_28129 [Puccinia coronata f. sp. avenae]|uniref:Uncharacterized protein n=1 Tax=Puccinia coronata f. sp. avenae TaxID=200324 RepID=A0A2N5RWE5_9BASI|nr:hypothetical protein PCANC_28129 [Puccinia coronata f. sp. avenae]